jgi:type VI protein secretion system component VasK
MILYIILALILWFVVPLFIEGHIRKKTDRKAWSMLSRIVAITLILLAIYRFLIL